jgi:hypothetical protein
MSDNTGKTVEEILREKLGSIKQARLPKGSPSWDDILGLTWEDIVRRAKARRRGYRTIRKLLIDRRFDK